MFCRENVSSNFRLICLKENGPCKRQQGPCTRYLVPGTGSGFPVFCPNIQRNLCRNAKLLDPEPLGRLVDTCKGRRKRRHPSQLYVTYITERGKNARTTYSTHFSRIEDPMGTQKCPFYILPKYQLIKVSAEKSCYSRGRLDVVIGNGLTSVARGPG